MHTGYIPVCLIPGPTGLVGMKRSAADCGSIKFTFLFHFLYDNSSKAYTQGLYHVGELRQSGNKGQYDCTFYDFYHIIGLDY